MRWLIAHPGPDFSVHDVFVGWSGALASLGEDVHVFNLHDRLAFYDSVVMPDDNGGYRKAVGGADAIRLAVNGLAASLFKVRPDILLIVSGFFTEIAMLDQARRQGTRIVLLATESPYEDRRQLSLAEHVDLVLLNDPLRIEEYRRIVQTVYVPHAYRPDVHHPGPSIYDPCDLAFVGTGYPSRIDFFESMDLGSADVVLGGNWPRVTSESPLRPYLGHAVNECLDNNSTAALYRAARMGINLYRREAENGNTAGGVAIGPREVEMSASELFFLRDPRAESDLILGALPSFSSPDEASELFHWYLSHSDVRTKLAKLAREAIEDRTFENHAAELLRMFDRQPVSVN